MGEPGVGAKRKDATDATDATDAADATDATDAGDQLQTPLKQQAAFLPITLPFPIVCW